MKVLIPNKPPIDLGHGCVTIVGEAGDQDTFLFRDIKGACLLNIANAEVYSSRLTLKDCLVTKESECNIFEGPPIIRQASE